MRPTTATRIAAPATESFGRIARRTPVPLRVVRESANEFGQRPAVAAARPHATALQGAARSDAARRLGDLFVRALRATAGALPTTLTRLFTTAPGETVS